MATIPVVPSFVPGETPSIAKLNQLAACVSWLTAILALGELTNTGQSIANVTATALNWNHGTNRDGGHSNATHPSRWTAQTPGYYDLVATVVWAPASGGFRQLYFQVTTGSGNPGGAGVTTTFGEATEQETSGGLIITTVTSGMTSPYLYAGDYLEVYAWQNSGGVVASGNTGAPCYWQLWLSSLGP